MANNRIAYGLCKKYGIKLKEGASPADAWKALREAGHGDEADAMSANSENEDVNEGKETRSASNPKKLGMSIDELNKQTFRNANISRAYENAKSNGQTPQQVLDTVSYDLDIQPGSEEYKKLQDMVKKDAKLINGEYQFRKYNIGSNKKLTGDDRKKMESLQKAFTNAGFDSNIKDGWEDYGAGMEWTSLTENSDGMSSWMLDPKQWIDYMNDDVTADELVKTYGEKYPNRRKVETSESKKYKAPEEGSFWSGNSPAQEDYEYLRKNNVTIPGSEKYYRWFNDGDYPAGLGASREDYQIWKYQKSEARRYLLQAERMKKMNPEWAEGSMKLFHEFNDKAKMYAEKINRAVEQTMTDKIKKLAVKHRKSTSNKNDPFNMTNEQAEVIRKEFYQGDEKQFAKEKQAAEQTTKANETKQSKLQENITKAKSLKGEEQLKFINSLSREEQSELISELLKSK